MNIYVRKMMLFVSYTAFVIIAPLVILYAIGYRPHTSSPIPRPVGVILADATPSQATISVNGTQYGTLPRSIPNIEPGIVSVNIQKEGYLPWDKQLEVKATQAMDIRSVQLLPTTFDTTVLTQNIVQFEPSPDNLSFATITNNNTIRIIDETGSIIIPEQKLLSRPTAISWSPDSSHILVTYTKNTHQLFQINVSSLIKVPSQELTGLSLIHWSPIAPNSIYALDKNRSLVSYTIGAPVKILKKNINLFTIVSRTLYYQTFENELGALQLRSLDDKTLLQDTTKALKKISGVGDGSLALLFSDGTLALRTSSGDYISISPNAEDMSWSPDEQLLLVQTAPTELSVYNVANERLFTAPLQELLLITRLSQTISNPRWFSDSLHIVYETNNSLLFSEIDTRDQPISRVIDNAKAAGQVTFGDRSESVLYMQKQGKETNLVQTWLVTVEDK